MYDDLYKDVSYEYQKITDKEELELGTNPHSADTDGDGIREYNGKKVIIVTELYQDNPGTSVTYAGKSLAEQICAAKGLTMDGIIYVECNPDTNSKLSFYDEEYFEVTFGEGKPSYKLLTKDEIVKYNI